MNSIVYQKLVTIYFGPYYYQFLRNTGIKVGCTVNQLFPPNLLRENP